MLDAMPALPQLKSAPPEKLRNYNQYIMSPEYQVKLAEAQAKRRK
jgi:hypothetical protein